MTRTVQQKGRGRASQACTQVLRFAYARLGEWVLCGQRVDHFVVPGKRGRVRTQVTGGRLDQSLERLPVLCSGVWNLS